MDADPIRAIVTVIIASLVILPPAGAQRNGQDPPHGAGIREVGHAPIAPRRGQDVIVNMELDDPTNVTRVVLVYCRAEHYACAPSLNMSRKTATSYEATIPWNAGFFRDVQNVGYNLTTKYANGNTSHSPTENWPYRPNSLPAEAGLYYFYPLAGEGGAAPASGAALLLLFFGLLAWRRRR